MNDQLLDAFALAMLAYVIYLLFRGSTSQRIGLGAAVVLGLMLTRILDLLSSAGDKITSVFTAGGR